MDPWQRSFNNSVYGFMACLKFIHIDVIYCCFAKKNYFPDTRACFSTTRNRSTSPAAACQSKKRPRKSSSALTQLRPAIVKQDNPHFQGVWKKGPVACDYTHISIQCHLIIIPTQIFIYILYNIHKYEIHRFITLIMTRPWIPMTGGDWARGKR